MQDLWSQCLGIRQVRGLGQVMCPLCELGIIIVAVHGVIVMMNLDNRSKELCQCLAHICTINVSSNIPNT